jgi:EAL domain-containing protein (putative c-di-GMP-specific phosphodiesterase class I)
MFVFYMSYDKKGEIIKEIEKLRKKISNNPFQYDIVTKFGIYLVNDRSIPVNLMCDRAMMAERTVKGNIMKFCAFYDEHYREEMLRAGQIEQDMEKALTEHQYQMYLQPKYRLKDNSLCGAEVLCRWQHPEKGLIPPNDFIPLFEKNGFILKLDEYMWEEACKNIRRWLDQGRSVVPISVNISRYHIQHNDLEKALMELIHKYDLTPDMLNLEITETAASISQQALEDNIKDLTNMGMKFSLDDFGTGYSNMQRIVKLPFDIIKLDRTFSELYDNPKLGIVLTNAINMIKAMKMKIVVEGVETEEMLKLFSELECEYIQGYYFSKPIPREEFVKFIQASS